jgi:hypothetical protein
MRTRCHVILWLENVTCQGKIEVYVHATATSGRRHYPDLMVLYYAAAGGTDGEFYLNVPLLFSAFALASGRPFESERRSQAAAFSAASAT